MNIIKFIPLLFCFVFGNSEEKIWIKANNLFKQSQYSAAAKTFLQIEEMYPASPKLKNALLLATKSFFLSKNYIKAIETTELLKELDYQYSEKHNVDDILIKSYAALLKRPERENKDLPLILSLSKNKSSKYKEIRQKCINILAYDNLNKGLLYSKRGAYLVSLKYYGKIIKEYPNSNFTPEAYFRCAEIFNHLKLIQDKNQCIKALSIKFKSSTWHNNATKLREQV